VIGLALQSTIVFGLASAANALLRRSSAAQRHAIWMAAFLSVPLLLLLPHLPLHVVPTFSISVASREAALATAGSGRRLADYLAVLWVAGTLGLLLRLALAYVLLRFESKKVEMPFAVGLLRPRIHLPQSSASWPAALRRNVILHEEAHIRRGDLLAQMFAHIVCALIWFQPLAWYAARRAAEEREMASDDLVLGSGVDATEYAGHLVDIARESVRVPSLAIGMAKRSFLEARLQALMNQSLSRCPLSPRWRFGLILGMAMVALIVSGLNAQEDGPVYKSGDPGVVAPKLTHKVHAKYTDDAQARGVSGVVTVSFEIDKSGKPRNMKITEGVDPDLDKSAAAAAGEYRFAPATKDGVPVVFAAAVRVSFALR